MDPPNQISWTPKIIKKVELIADSPKKAFYVLTIFEHWGRYWIEKESGAAGKVLDRRRWPQPSKKIALKKFYQKLNQKLKRDRNNPRKYVRIKN